MRRQRVRGRTGLFIHKRVIKEAGTGGNETKLSLI